MCGIAGLIGAFREPETLLEKMKKSIAHRGPDQEGSFADRAGRVYLGHRRLSIIDGSEGARQPLERGGAVIVFNGEIYNYRDLFEELKGEFEFSTASDTEVLLNAYLKWGIRGALSRVKGMFAFCVYDAARKKLFFARDRAGEKPFYYFVKKDRFAFSSELKALRHIGEAHEVDFKSLDLYLTFGYVPAPDSIIKGVFKLMPGHFMTLDMEGMNPVTEKYWDLDPLREKTVMDEAAAKERLFGLLDSSVRRSLFSDVPLGVFLSGGIDSSVVAHFAARHSRKIKTFSVAYDDRSFDESKYSRLMAKRLDSDHHELNIDFADAKDAIKNLGAIIDEPMADMSLVPVYLLSKLTRRHVAVALGGDGADELFLGYPTHLAHRLVGFYGAVPSFIRKRLIERAIKSLPVSHKDFSLEFRLKRFVDSAAMAPLLRHFSWQAHVPLGERAGLYGSDYDSTGNLLGFFSRTGMPEIKDAGRLTEFLDLKFYLPNDILSKVDTASMANSLEVRAPFLDHELVEFAYYLDDSVKFRWFNQKYILKRLAAGFLPKEVVYRKKHGFGIPIGRWLREDLHEYAKETLSGEGLGRFSCLDRRRVGAMLAEHASGAKDNRKQIWALLVLASWMKSYNDA